MRARLLQASPISWAAMAALTGVTDIHEPNRATVRKRARPPPPEEIRQGRIASSARDRQTSGVKKEWTSANKKKNQMLLCYKE